MDLGLGGKRALVCASSKGLGFGVAQALSREGATVTLNGRNAETLEAAAQALSGPAHAVAADIGTREGCEWLVEEAERRMGGIDILVNNSGGPPAGRFLELDEERWAAGIDSTLMNVVRCVRMVVPGMAERGWGRIVTIASTSAREPIPELTISNTLRPGIIGLTADLARELGPKGITINCVAPGPFATDRQAALLQRRSQEQGRTVEEVLEESKAQAPMRRHGEPIELGDAVAFLCSERAGFITGEPLFVDGGLVRCRL